MPEGLGEVRVMSSGSQLIEFHDMCGDPCELESGYRTRGEDTDIPVVRLGVFVGFPRVNLDKDLARKLIVNLQKWVDSGEFE